MNTGRYGRRGVLWVALALLGLCLAGHALHYDYVVDDAFISFRYAQNFLQGHGLVYNPGERVEGYTNFLWVLLVALGMVAGADPAPFSQALGFAAAAATLCVVFLRPVALSRSPAYVRLLAPALLCLSPPFALWSVGGLETSLFTFFVFSGLSAGARRESGASGAVWDTVSGLSLALACLTRPEGFLAFLLVVGNRVLWPATPGGRFPIRLVMAWAVVVVPYELWRWSYYGFLFPNSYYAKVGWGG
ncbi:MAG: hypothetical protein KAW17_04935, partial [Candidatus Eisenbacteria sp.]|nr:hypothetical protein [Candidatus Eisenbacteria bacterium]